MSHVVKKSFFQAAHGCLMADSVAAKLSLTEAVYHALLAGELAYDEIDVKDIPRPGRPDKPEMVEVRALPRRNFHSSEGHAALMHAIAHIEFNAIDLAWDAVYRFPGMPEAFYFDWARVASEEAQHFRLIHDYLQQLGFQYGDFGAHNGLWDMAVETAYDPLVRMALVPRVMEARGLDVTPGIMHKLQHSGFRRAAEILEVIYQDEHGHVEIGNKWFHFLCEQRKVQPLSIFKDLIRRHAGGKIRKPINDQARRDAGFTEEELLYLHSVI